MTGLDHCPILTQTKEIDSAGAGSTILAPGAATLLHIFTDNGPEGIVGLTYRTTESGAWRQSAWMGEHYIQSLQAAPAGLLQFARILLNEVPNGSYRLKCDQPKSVPVLPSGAWWGMSGKRMTAVDGIPIEAYAQGIGNPEGILDLLTDHNGPMFPGVCWGLPIVPATEAWVSSPEFQRLQPITKTANAGRSFYRGLAIGSASRLARQKAKGFAPTGKTDGGRQISGLYADLSSVTQLLCQALSDPDATPEHLSAQLDRWRKTSGLFAVHVMLGSQALAAAQTIWGNTLGTEQAAEVLSEWSKRYIMDAVVPSIDHLEDFCKYPGGDRVQELAARWADATILGFKHGASVLHSFVANGANNDAWVYGDTMGETPKHSQMAPVPIIDLSASSPIIVSESEISSHVRLEAPEVVRRR